MSNCPPTNRTICGILAIVINGLAIHKFMMGKTNVGIIQIVITICTCGLGGLIGIVEGIIYLTKSDEEWYNTYITGGKDWF